MARVFGGACYTISPPYGQTGRNRWNVRYASPAAEVCVELAPFKIWFVSVARGGVDAGGARNAIRLLNHKCLRAPGNREEPSSNAALTWSLSPDRSKNLRCDGKKASFPFATE